MIGGKIKTLKEEIIEILMSNSASSKKIKTILSGNGFTVTIQGIYKQLNTLLASGVILKNKQNYSISNEWIKELSDMLSIQDIELPEEGEKFTYKFNSLQKLDAQWKHIMSSFRKKFPNTAIYSYCPHQFWIYLPTREKSAKTHIKEHENVKTYNFFTLGGESDLDKKYRKQFNGNYYKTELLKMAGDNRTEHTSALGDIIVSSKITKYLSIKIDSIYESDLSIKEKELKLIKLISKNYKCSIYIENHPRKTEKMRKRISQPFYIPSEIKKKN